MKTLKFIGLALLAIVMCFNFTACSNDDDNANTTNNLEETWFLIQTKYSDGAMETFDPSNPTKNAEQLIFMKSAKPNIYNVREMHYYDDYEWQVFGYYIYDSKTNRITDYEVYGEIIKLTNNQLTIKWHDPGEEGDDVWTSVYTRIK